MFAIVDVSRRATRGKILMLIDDQGAAAEIAVELNRRSVEVRIQGISSEQLDQFQADLRAGTSPPRAHSIA